MGRKEGERGGKGKKGELFRQEGKKLPDPLCDSSSEKEEKKRGKGVAAR